MSNDWGWGDDTKDFGKSKVDEYQFYTSPSGSGGQSDILQSRCDPELARQIDELIFRGRDKGVVPFKTRSDFVRYACFNAMISLAEYIGESDEGFDHYMIIQKEALRQAQVTEMLVEVTKTVKSLLSGLQVLMVASEFVEAKHRIEEFIQTIMKLAGDNDLLLRLYVKAMTESRFGTLLKTLDQKIDLGPSIKNLLVGQ